MSTMLSPGRYKAENNDNFLSQYSIVMEVKETEKSYIFQLVELNSRYSADHIKHLFAKLKRVIIRKNCGGHAMRVWGMTHLHSTPFRPVFRTIS